MDKSETIISVMEAFDEAERLRQENAELRRRDICRALAESTIAEDVEKPRWFADIYAYGRKAIWEKHGERKYYRMCVDVTESDDGTKRVESFGHWAKDNYPDRPDFMSKDDFMEEFEEEMRARYDEERAKALGGD